MNTDITVTFSVTDGDDVQAGAYLDASLAYMREVADDQRRIQSYHINGTAPIDRYTGLRNAARAVIEKWAIVETGGATTLGEAVERLDAALDAAPSFTDPHGRCSQCGAVLTRVEARDRSHQCTPNRVVLTIEGGVLQAVHADRPAEVLVTLFDFDVESDDDHPTVRRLDVPGRARGPVSVGVDLPVAQALDADVEAMLAQVQDT